MKPKYLDQPSDAEVRLAIEQNLINKVRYYPDLLSAMQVSERFGITCVNTGLQSSTFNVICGVSAGIEDLKQKFQELCQEYRNARLPFCCWVGPSSPTDLSILLTEEGWIYEATDLGLAADLRKILIQPQLPPDVKIQRVTHSDLMMDFSSVLENFFHGAESQGVHQFYEKVGENGLNDSSPLQNFVAYFQGIPVATASFFISNGVAGFYDCCTLPEMRRKGIGQAMMMTRFQYILDLGLNWVTLSSSHDSRGLYQRLGFQTYCEFSTFVSNWK